MDNFFILFFKENVINLLKQDTIIFMINGSTSMKYCMKSSFSKVLFDLIIVKSISSNPKLILNIWSIINKAGTLKKSQSLMTAIVLKI